RAYARCGAIQQSVGHNRPDSRPATKYANSADVGAGLTKTINANDCMCSYIDGFIKISIRTGARIERDRENGGRDGPKRKEKTPHVTGGNKNGAQIGERIERSESLPSPTGRFDGFVPLMFHPSARCPPLPLAISTICYQSNSPNNVFLPPCAGMPVQGDGGFPPLENVPPFLSSGRQKLRKERSGREVDDERDAAREEGKSPDNQRLWRRAIVLPILRGVVKDACYERRTDKMTDRCAFLTYYSRDSAISAQNALHEKRTLPGGWKGGGRSGKGKERDRGDGTDAASPRCIIRLSVWDTLQMPGPDTRILIPLSWYYKNLAFLFNWEGPERMHILAYSHSPKSRTKKLGLKGTEKGKKKKHCIIITDRKAVPGGLLDSAIADNGLVQAPSNILGLITIVLTRCDIDAIS
ncbi:CUG-BP-and ETR-3-like factor 3, partial [Temnothorax longispinosus]